MKGRNITALEWETTYSIVNTCLGLENRSKPLLMVEGLYIVKGVKYLKMSDLRIDKRTSGPVDPYSESIVVFKPVNKVQFFADLIPYVGCISPTFWVGNVLYRSD